MSIVWGLILSCLNKFMGKLGMLSWRLDHSNGLHNNNNMILIKLEFLIVYTIEELTFKEEKPN